MHKSPWGNFIRRFREREWNRFSHVTFPPTEEELDQRFEESYKRSLSDLPVLADHLRGRIAGEVAGFLIGSDVGNPQIVVPERNPSFSDARLTDLIGTYLRLYKSDSPPHTRNQDLNLRLQEQLIEGLHTPESLESIGNILRAQIAQAGIDISPQDGIYPRGQNSSSQISILKDRLTETLVEYFHYMYDMKNREGMERRVSSDVYDKMFIFHEFEDKYTPLGQTDLSSIVDAFLYFVSENMLVATEISWIRQNRGRIFTEVQRILSGRGVYLHLKDRTGERDGIFLDWR